MKKFLSFLLALLLVAGCFALTGCNECSNPDGHDFMVHGGPGGKLKCIYCGKVKSQSSSSGGGSGSDFWDAVGQGALTVLFMLTVTAIASVAYWLGCMFGWGWLVWVGHGIMGLMMIGMFIVYHWIWGVVFIVLFGGAYLGIICPLITQQYYDYNGIIH